MPTYKISIRFIQVNTWIMQHIVNAIWVFAIIVIIIISEHMLCAWLQDPLNTLDHFIIAGTLYSIISLVLQLKIQTQKNYIICPNHTTSK